MKKNKNKYIIIFFLIFLLIFVVYTIFEITTSIGEEDRKKDDSFYMLRASHWFYKGSKNMSQIQTITFSREAPSDYDECWNANITNTDDVKGYLIGVDVVIVGKHIYANSNCSYMFAECNRYEVPLWTNLTEINGLELLDTSYVDDMSGMFSYSSKLTELNGIGEWDVSNVETFAGMFQGHSHAGDMKFKYLDVGKWDTSSAKNLSHLFYGCALLTNIEVGNWDVSNVTTFSHMFADCYSLKTIDFSKWETSSVESFDALLNDCHSLVVIDVSGLDTKTCLQFSQMFEACINLEHIIGLDTWDVTNASYYAFSEMFHCCYNLKEIDIGSWITTPGNTARMFKNCHSITEIDLSGFNMSNNLYTTEMFMNCENLTNVIGYDYKASEHNQKKQNKTNKHKIQLH